MESNKHAKAAGAGAGAWIFDAADLNAAGAYDDVVGHFRQFGFFDLARFDDLVTKVLLPNARWTSSSSSTSSSTLGKRVTADEVPS